MERHWHVVYSFVQRPSSSRKLHLDVTGFPHLCLILGGTVIGRVTSSSSLFTVQFYPRSR